MISKRPRNSDGEKEQESAKKHGNDLFRQIASSDKGGVHIKDYNEKISFICDVNIRFVLGTGYHAAKTDEDALFWVISGHARPSLRYNLKASEERP